jgi:hypothetical protein
VLFVLFMVIGYAREYGVGNLWAILRRYVEVRMVVPNQDGTSSDGGSASSRDLVPGHQHHAEPVELGDQEPAAFARQLAKEELIILLAVQRNEDGGYRYSANQITAFVGGAAAPIKATIATVRGKKEQPPPGAPLRRPVNGW